VGRGNDGRRRGTGGKTGAVRETRGACGVRLKEGIKRPVTRKARKRGRRKTVWGSQPGREKGASVPFCLEGSGGIRGFMEKKGKTTEYSLPHQALHMAENRGNPPKGGGRVLCTAQGFLRCSLLSGVLRKGEGKGQFRSHPRKENNAPFSNIEIGRTRSKKASIGGGKASQSCRERGALGNEKRRVRQKCFSETVI